MITGDISTGIGVTLYATAIDISASTAINATAGGYPPDTGPGHGLGGSGVDGSGAGYAGFVCSFEKFANNLKYWRKRSHWINRWG